MTRRFQALLVEEEKGAFVCRPRQRSMADLPPGEVLLRVHYAALNYKDALSASGNRGVTRNYPHVPGIDAAGVVEESSSPQFQPGDQIIVTGYDLGANSPGGLSEYARVPASWPQPLPPGLSLREAMILGTAGLTAAIGIDKIRRLQGEGAGFRALVSGASGGVGSLAVSLFAGLGYEVIAVSGKEEQHALLRRLGAREILPRESLGEELPRGLETQEWHCAVDCVGGTTLVNILKKLHNEGSVACCGLVQSPQIAMQLFPFILRGVNLLGIDSVSLPGAERARLWALLAGPWKPAALEDVARDVSLEEAPRYLEELLAGRMWGRALVNLSP